MEKVTKYSISKIEVDCIGMEPFFSQDFYLHSIIKREEVNDLIERYLPQFKNKEITNKAKITALPDYLTSISRSL